jgi:hypothetical protein
MNNLFEKWRTKIPQYSEEFRELLFDSLSKKYGGSEKSKEAFGKHFSNNYELYIYAFFLGLYNNEFVPIQEKKKKVDFSHAIQYWGNKGNRIDRLEFSDIQEYIFSALIAKSEFDLIELEKGTLKEDDAVKSLIYTMESYTNGGLTLIKEKLEDNSNFFLQTTSFLNLILESKINKKKTVK